MADSQDSRIKVDRTQGEGTSVLLDIKNLRTTFGTISGDVQAVRGIFEKKRFLKAVDGVSFSIETGTTMGLVGESGCGKTTLGRALLRLYDIEEGGKIFFDGTDISHLNDQQMRSYRKRMQMIFQDPYTSLDPRKTVGATIGEPLEALDIMQGKAAQDRIRELIELVGLKTDHLGRYPHEFSGGQRQRIGIARALAADPEFIVCDEPISAMDVSIQAQVINILEELQEKFHFTYLFISHDLSMVRHISHKVGVMYLGNLIEYAQVDELYEHMLHPYTQCLKICEQKKPELKKINKEHYVACHLYGEALSE